MALGTSHAAGMTIRAAKAAWLAYGIGLCESLARSSEHPTLRPTAAVGQVQALTEVQESVSRRQLRTVVAVIGRDVAPRCASSLHHRGAGRAQNPSASGRGYIAAAP